jgi:hypothetical protein
MKKDIKFHVDGCRLWTTLSLHVGKGRKKFIRGNMSEEYSQVAFNYWCFGSKVLKWHSTTAANAR